MLPEIQEVNDLLRDLDQMIVEEAKKYKLKGETEDQKERNKIDDFIDSMHRKMSVNCTGILNSFKKSIEELEANIDSIELLTENETVLNQINLPKYLVDHESYLRNVEFRYLAPKIVTKLILAFHIKDVLIEKLLASIELKLSEIQTKLFPGSPPSKSLKKVNTSYTLEELAFLFNLFEKEGLIIHKPRTDIYRLISSCFTTPQRKNISERSLKNKYNNPSNKTIISIHAKLANLVSRLNKMR